MFSRAVVVVVTINQRDRVRGTLTLNEQFLSRHKTAPKHCWTVLFDIFLTLKIVFYLFKMTLNYQNAVVCLFIYFKPQFLQKRLI